MSDTRDNAPTSPSKPSFAEDAWLRRYREFVARHWRPVPAPPRSGKPAFWASSWEDAKELFRG